MSFPRLSSSIRSLKDESLKKGNGPLRLDDFQAPEGLTESVDDLQKRSGRLTFSVPSAGQRISIDRMSSISNISEPDFNPVDENLLFSLQEQQRRSRLVVDLPEENDFNGNNS